jgi:hypothetical protein
VEFRSKHERRNTLSSAFLRQRFAKWKVISSFEKRVGVFDCEALLAA